jgi:hypothetical protein
MRRRLMELTEEEIVRLGKEAAEHIGRPVTEDELRALCDHLISIRIDAASLSLWNEGRLGFAPTEDDVILFLTEESV